MPPHTIQRVGKASATPLRFDAHVSTAETGYGTALLDQQAGV
ncbi:hypothetical protein [Streptomyces sp. NPDC052701]